MAKPLKSLLITGGTGTFGKACIHRALKGGWNRVISYSRDEVKIAALCDDVGRELAFRAFQGDVRDGVRLSLAMRGVTHVIHAAALKRVDQGAYSPTEMIDTNINGTRNVLMAALSNGVEKVIVLSSDKSVHPTNLYGASKFVAETLAVHFNAYSYPAGTKIAAVRYGNVLGSRGSVIELWRKQAASGEPLTLTDPRMSRFVLTVGQAVRYVESALNQTKGGEVFVPLLPSVTLGILAEAVAPGSRHTITGLRPGGEKLAESLLNEDEPRRTVEALWGMGGYIIRPHAPTWAEAERTWPGQVLGEDFHYRSDAPPLGWLTPDAVRELLAEDTIETSVANI